MDASQYGSKIQQQATAFLPQDQMQAFGGAFQEPVKAYGGAVQEPVNAGGDAVGKLHQEVRIFVVIGFVIIGTLVAFAGIILLTGYGTGLTTARGRGELVTVNPKQVRDELSSILPPQHKEKPAEKNPPPVKPVKPVKPPGNAPRADPLPRTTLVCTVNGEGPSLANIRPPMGVCGIIFFDSMYKEVQPKHADVLSANEKAFLDWTQSYAYGEFGVSFSTWKLKLEKEITTSRFKATVQKLHENGIKHAAVINIHRPSVNKQHFIVALKALKIAYKTLKEMKSDKPSYAVFGAAFDRKYQYELVELMGDYFVPSLFIAITHISYDDRKQPYCRILPPTWLSIPASFPEDDFPYGTSLTQSCDVFSEVSTARIRVPVAVSFTLSGHMYHPDLSDPTSATNDKYQVFQSCQDFDGEYYVTPGEQCENHTQLKDNAQKLPQEDVVFSFDTSAERMLTLDNEETMQHKVCETRNTCKNVPFGVAAFDVEYDAPRTPCEPLGLRGPFGRVALLRSLNNHLRNAKPASPFDKAKCLSVTIDDVRRRA